MGAVVEPGSALILGEGNAEHAHVAQPGDDLAREAPLLFMLLDDRLDFLRQEVTQRTTEQLVLGGKRQIHGREASTRCPLQPNCNRR